jgi:prepilin-type N-terminal cleavage/methylation domain-containing protein/prepilin-type processing-associated H-X9-DG protein
MKKAFTLIELLVVITIIAILASILFPVFAQAKGSAQNTMDLSNIRQTGISLQLYLNDNDDTFVQVGSWNDPTITPYTNPNGPLPNVPWNGWALKLDSYTKNTNVFHSPFMPKNANWWTGACATSNGMPITSTYAYNWYLGADWSYDEYPGEYYHVTPDGTRFDSPLTSSAVAQPSNVMAFQMSQTTSPYGNAFGCDYNMIEDPDWNNQIQFRAIFNSGGNLSYADGHAKFLIAGVADSAGTNYPNCQGSPSHTIYIWQSKGLWSYPYFPNNNGGLPTEPEPLACAQ